MLSHEDNQKLCLTGPGTAMGRLFRRFWLPVLLSEELSEVDGAPIRVKVLHEDLVAFRDTEGKIGLIDPRCPHRGADFFFGRNEQGGIRCVYHGWKFDRHGDCLDIPSLPSDSSLKAKIRLKAYPTREAGGIVWAYMGPPEHEPAFPRFEFATMSVKRRYASKKLQECNWAQACEGSIDTAHFSFLHMGISEDEDELQAAVSHSDLSGSEAMKRRIRWIKQDGVPRYTVLPHEAGLVLGAARSADEGHSYWRVAQILMPNHSLAPGAFPGENHHGQAFVPIDDHSCWIYCYTWNPYRDLQPEEIDKFKTGHVVHASVDKHYVPLRNRRNDYLIDRDDQRSRSYTGIQGLSEQDACIQDSQGYIADRTQEHLIPTDAAIVQFRRTMLQAAADLDKGMPPLAAAHPEAYFVRSGALLAEQDTPLETALIEQHGDPAWRVTARETKVAERS